MKRQTICPIHYLNDHPRDRLPESIKIDSHLSLTRFDNKKVDSVVKEYPDFYSSYDISELKSCRYSAVYEYESTDKNAADEGQIKVHRLVESLRIIRPTRASFSTFVFNVEANGDLTPQSASQKSEPIYLVEGEDIEKSTFVTSDAEKIRIYYKYVDSLYSTYQGKYNRILNSFIFFQLGYMIFYSKMRIVPFVTSLESLFNTSEQEVAYSLRIRCGTFLGNNIKEKNDYVERIRRIYQVRSASVHGSSLPKKVLKDLKQGDAIMKDSEEICRKCFQKIIDKNLTKYFSQDNDALTRYLDDMVLTQKGF